MTQIEKGSATADSWRFQGPDFNHMHALRRKDESVESAKSRMQDFVNDHFKNYRAFLERGEDEKAYFELGMALHPIMDSTSPAHQGFQEWDHFMNTTGYDLIKHSLQERSMSPEQLSKTLDLIKQALDL